MATLDPSAANGGGDPARPRGQTTAAVEDHETWVEEKRFTMYKVVVRLEDRSYFIFRRYNEFNTLLDKIKKRYPDSNLKLPGKRIFLNNFDPAFIKQRRQGLNDFIVNLIKIPSIFDDEAVRDFLSLDDQRSTIPIYDRESLDEEAGSEDKTANRFDLGTSEKESAAITDFKLLKVIGKGSFGKVYLGRHIDTNKHYAIKVLQKKAIVKRNEVKHIMAERNVLLRNVTHPFLVGLHYSFQTGTKLYFVLDYVNGGELFFHLQRERVFEEPRARFYAAEITSALGYLHEQDIVYRDLKPENILLDKQGHIILTDFGLCKEDVKQGETTSTFCGTPEYLAPEVLRKQDYGRPVDWWCLGVVTYEMMYGLPPFYSRDVAEMYDGILHKPLRLRPNITPAGRSLLEGLLQKDKNHRLGSGVRDYKDIMDHLFFRSINWDDLFLKKLEPPFNPNVSGDLDLRHFDQEFTNEAISDNPSPPKSTSAGMSISVQDETFAGFSYIPNEGKYMPS
ncbi:PREDICTED: serine/threonine-protein kinase Sgk1-like [Amphimedon queenslandica]|uniref:Non-specific serine/threonine protein kinase n=1 Tax=Amphimedon queenslandica TaxID=400682 RepID=A0A1X7UYE6_AMPQE|nr:PREDICTED: serine/threonine-protein kinase Sgk1-like [Amphimedon queenslandica]|eukprot:XP_011403713.2 PREDICTED: serine/threonine-protein kinase Sgk1-like [Amphimedon queenslandica]